MSKRRRVACLLTDRKRCGAIHAMTGGRDMRSGSDPIRITFRLHAFRRWCMKFRPSRREQEIVYAANLFVSLSDALRIAANASGIRDAARLAQCVAAMR